MGMYLNINSSSLDGDRQIKELGGIPYPFVTDNPLKYDSWSNEPIIKPPLDDDEVMVCLIDNTFYQTAGIAFNDNEFNAFNEGIFNREKKWFILKKKIAAEKCIKYKNYLNNIGDKYEI
jgi:hypothetical protein